MNSCNNTCGTANNGSGILIVLVVYILLVIILGSHFTI